MCQKLFEDHKEMKGHCNIPTKNNSLGNLIELQRTLFRSKKLKEDRHEKLVEIGFAFEAAFEIKEKLDQQWQEMYQKLLEHEEMPLPMMRKKKVSIISMIMVMAVTMAMHTKRLWRNMPSQLRNWWR
jgi:hypothetical protein